MCYVQKEILNIIFFFGGGGGGGCTLIWDDVYVIPLNGV